MFSLGTLQFLKLAYASLADVQFEQCSNIGNDPTVLSSNYPALANCWQTSVAVLFLFPLV